MKEATYNVIWTECYEKAGIAILNTFSQELREKFRWRCDFTEEKYRELFLRYKYNHDILRDRYFYGKSNPDKLIDVHKIAACFAKSIIEAAPMSFEIIDGIPWFIKSSNYALAFHTSINIVSFFLQAELERNAENGISNAKKYLNDYVKMGHIQYPKTSYGHDTYTVGRIKAMAMRDIWGEEFDILAYADMLFWIELFNKQLLE